VLFGNIVCVILVTLVKSPPPRESRIVIILISPDGWLRLLPWQDQVVTRNR
jgi:hypothetical protein